MRHQHNAATPRSDGTKSPLPARSTLAPARHLAATCDPPDESCHVVALSARPSRHRRRRLSADKNEIRRESRQRDCDGYCYREKQPSNAIAATSDDLRPSHAAKSGEQRIHATPNIEIRYHSTVDEVCGGEQLEQVVLRDTDSGERQVEPACALFDFIGATPRTDWLDGRLARDEKGFILTGPEVLAKDAKDWRADRDP